LFVFKYIKLTSKQDQSIPFHFRAKNRPV